MISKAFIEKQIFELSKDFRNLSDIMIHLYYKIFNVYPQKFYLQQYSLKEGVVIEKFEGNFDDNDEDCENVEGLNLDKKKFCKFIEEDDSIYVFLYEGDYYTCKFAVGENFIFAIPRLGDWSNGWKYCPVLSESSIYLQKLKQYIILDEKQDSSIKYYFVVGSSQGFKLRPMFLEKDKITVSLEDNYNKDLPIKEIKNFIENQLGIFIFNGIPGTGKSSLLKYLISNMEDHKFIWMDSDLLVNINSEAFISFIVDDAKESIIILEDCEKLLTDRKLSYNQNLGTLLNISDGILGDSLKLKFICTFNSDLRNIDSAILRKGRLKGKYEFKKLSIEKTNNLCEKIGVQKMNCEASLADIYNQAPIDFGEQKKTKIGF